MSPELNLPPRFTWATNSNRTLTAADLTPPIDPADGHDYNQRPNPKLMNWFHQNLSRTYDQLLARWLRDTRSMYNTPGASNLTSVARHSTSGRWILATATGPGSYYSFDGVTWTAAGAPTATPYSKALIVNTTDGFLLGTASALNYSADGAVWSSTGGQTRCLANYGYSDFFITANATTSMLIYAAGATGGSVSPTSTSWGATNIECMTAESSAAIYGLVDVSGNFHRSTDSADNWTQSGQGPIDAIASFDPKDIAFSNTYQSNSTYVCVGENGSVEKIAYSHDSGANWSEATIEEYTCTNPASGLLTVIALGQGLWMAAGDPAAAYSDACYISIDDGETWYPTTLTPATSIAGIRQIDHLWCDGERIMGCGTNQIIFTPSFIGTI